MSVTQMPSARRTSAEGQTRIDLAACYRLVDLFGWSDLINTRITARVPGAPDHFLINPYGMLYDEITASSLVKIDSEGNEADLLLTESLAIRVPQALWEIAAAIRPRGC